MSQKYNICIIPEQGGRARNMRLSSFVLTVVISVVLLGAMALASTLSVYSYQYYLSFKNRNFMTLDDSAAIDYLRLNNSSLQSQLESFAQQVAKLDAKMAVLEDRKTEAVSLLSKVKDQYSMPRETPVAEVLPHLSATVAWANNQDGVGGSEQLSNALALNAVAGSSRDVVRGLHRDLDRLLAEADDSWYYWDSLNTNLGQAHSILAATPLFLPLDGRISGVYGHRRSPFGGRSVELHRGVDIPAPTGTLVRSPADGTVISADYAGGYGLMVVVNHGYGLITRYAHLSNALVEVGDLVSRGQTLAYSGNSGRSTGSHLHYETILAGVPVDPFRLLPKSVVENLVFKKGVQSLD